MSSLCQYANPSALWLQLLPAKARSLSPPLECVMDSHLLCLIGHWQMWCHQKPEKCFGLLWRSSGLELISVQGTRVRSLAEGTKVPHATWCGQIFLFKSVWLWSFPLSSLLLELRATVTGRTSLELACWSGEGMCAQLPLLCQPPAESHLLWLAGDCRDMSEQRSSHCRLPELGTNEMAVALSKPLNVGVFCYTEKANLCIFLLPFIFLFLSSYLSSLFIIPSMLFGFLFSFCSAWVPI